MTNQTAATQPNPEATALIANITQLMDEAEQMLQESTSHHAEGQVDLLRVDHDDVQPRIVGLFTEAGKKIAVGVEQTDRVIRARPYQSLAVALGIGALLGVMLARRS